MADVLKSEEVSEKSVVKLQILQKVRGDLQQDHEEVSGGLDHLLLVQADKLFLFQQWVIQSSVMSECKQLLEIVSG